MSLASILNPGQIYAMCSGKPKDLSHLIDKLLVVEVGRSTFEGAYDMQPYIVISLDGVTYMANYYTDSYDSGHWTSFELADKKDVVRTYDYR